MIHRDTVFWLWAFISIVFIWMSSELIRLTYNFFKVLDFFFNFLFFKAFLLYSTYFLSSKLSHMSTKR